MENSFENRFNHLKTKSTEELIAILKEAKEDLEYMQSALYDKEVSWQEKSEYQNTDIPYDRDKIRYIEEELKTRSLK